MNDSEKEKLVESIVEHMKNKNLAQEKSMSDYVNEIEPYSWMDSDCLEHLKDKLTPEEFENFDNHARAMIAGSRFMVGAMREALERFRNRRDQK